MSKQSKERVHGRPVHRSGGGCDTGRACYRSKQECETATDDVAERCDRCRQWHAKKDRPRSRRGRQKRTR